MDDADAATAFMRLAIALSERAMAEGTGFPFGAVVVRDGAVLAEGYNQVFADNDPTAHAEVVAIRRACERVGSPVLDGCTIYTSGEPCPMCLGAIYWAGIEKIYYANDLATSAAAGFGDSRLYREAALPRTARAIPSAQLLADEGRAAFDAWQARSRGRS